MPLPAVKVPDVTQRWAAGRQSWRRHGRFDPDRHVVEPVPEPVAKAFVTGHHYSGTYPAAIHRFGLFDRRQPADDGRPGRLVGVAVFAMPMQAKVLTGPFPDLAPAVESVELSRFVLHDDVPANAESWTLARTFAALHDRGVRGVVSFADLMPRRRADGTTVTPGHVGTIYQATNALYAGRATARTITVLPDGTTLSARAMQKVRRGEQGHAYVTRRLVDLGAAPPDGTVDAAAWLAASLTGIGAVKVRHRGNHRFVFPLGANRRARDRIRIGLPVGDTYPKQPDTT